jgi:hypothetical protein
MTKLNVGDIVCYNSGWGVSKHKIERVTDKRAFFGGITLERDVDENRRIETVPRRSRCGVGGYYLPNERLNKVWLLEAVQYKVERLKVENISDEDLRAIAERLGINA